MGTNCVWVSPIWNPLLVLQITTLILSNLSVKNYDYSFRLGKNYRGPWVAASVERLPSDLLLFYTVDCTAVHVGGALSELPRAGMGVTAGQLDLVSLIDVIIWL